MPAVKHQQIPARAPDPAADAQQPRPTGPASNPAFFSGFAAKEAGILRAKRELTEVEGAHRPAF